MDVTALVLLLIGLATGCVIGYLFGQGRSTAPALVRAEADRAQAESARDLDEHHHAIESLVEPMRDALDRVQAQLYATERDRIAANASLDEHLTEMRRTADGLRTETAQLVTALRAPHVRGRWGELQLQRAVEIAGLVEHVDFDTQTTTTTDEGVLRPDMIVHLVGGKTIVVDSKVAFSAFLEAMEATDHAIRVQRLKTHAKQLRTHVDALGAKEYWRRFAASPEFVVCFVPADTFLDAALKEDPSLLEHAFARNVVLATPTTLVALLRTIGYTWRQDTLAANTAQVSALGRELYQRLSTLGGHFDRLGRSLSAAVGAFNQTVGTLETRVLVSARRLSDLAVVDIQTEGTLPAPEQLSASTRPMTADELAGQVP